MTRPPKPWTDRWDRMLRYYAELALTYQGRDAARQATDTRAYTDHIYAFMTECAHLHESLKYDATVSNNVAAEALNLRRTDQYVRISADLANTHKHANRVSGDPSDVRGITVHLGTAVEIWPEDLKPYLLGRKTWSGSDEEWASQLERIEAPATVSPQRLAFDIEYVDAGQTRQIDALVLAEGCIDAWRALLTHRGLL